MCPNPDHPPSLCPSDLRFRISTLRSDLVRFSISPFGQSGTVCLPPNALDRDVLCSEYLILERIHTRSSLIDATCKGDRSLKNGFQPFAILNTRARIFVLDDEVCVCDIQRQQFTCGELVIEPVHGTVL